MSSRVRQIDSTSFTWEIDFHKVSSSNCTTSPYITCNKNYQFFLEFRSTGGQCTVNLYRCVPHSDLNIVWRVSLVNDVVQQCLTKEIATSFTVNSQHRPTRGGRYTIDRAVILEPSNRLLKNGKLIIHCQVIIGDTKSIW